MRPVTPAVFTPKVTRFVSLVPCRIKAASVMGYTRVVSPLQADRFTCVSDLARQRGLFYVQDE